MRSHEQMAVAKENRWFFLANPTTKSAIAFPQGKKIRSKIL